MKAYASVAEARSAIGGYFGFYNTRRPHSSLERRTPGSGLPQLATADRGGLNQADVPLINPTFLFRQTQPALHQPVPATTSTAAAAEGEAWDGDQQKQSEQHSGSFHCAIHAEPLQISWQNVEPVVCVHVPPNVQAS